MGSLVSNPIHVYSLIYRIIKLLPGVIKSMDICDLKDEAFHIESMFFDGDDEISKFDLLGSMESLLRIQHTYRFKL